MKLFVGRLSHDATAEELEEYFSKFGKLTDVYLPKPFRNFAFITYASTEDAREVMRGHHELKGSKMNIEERKSSSTAQQAVETFNRRGSSPSSSRNRSSGGGFNNYSNSRDSSSLSSSRNQSSGGGYNNYSNSGDSRRDIPSTNSDMSTELKTLLYHYLSKN